MDSMDDLHKEFNELKKQVKGILQDVVKEQVKSLLQNNEEEFEKASKEKEERVTVAHAGDKEFNKIKKYEDKLVKFYIDNGISMGDSLSLMVNMALTILGKYAEYSPHEIRTYFNDILDKYELEHRNG